MTTTTTGPSSACRTRRDSSISATWSRCSSSRWTTSTRRRDRAELEAAAGKGFMSTNWMEQNRALFRALRLERVVTFITIGLIVFVAALNILISLIMMVMEKTRDIAVLVSMGAKKRQIRRIFISQGLLIGVIGTVIRPDCWVMGSPGSAGTTIWSRSPPRFIPSTTCPSRRAAWMACWWRWWRSGSRSSRPCIHRGRRPVCCLRKR